MPPKAAEVVVLCEDAAHEVFVSRFLRKWFVGKKKRISVVPYPEGDGSGKNHVLDTLPQQVKALRSGPSSAVLLVVLDADQKSVQHWQEVLDKATRRQKTTNNIAYIIPKWSIETWLAYLSGNESVNEHEQHKYKQSYNTKENKSIIHPLVDSLSAACRQGRELVSPPESLHAACFEFQRIRHLL